MTSQLDPDEGEKNIFLFFSLLPELNQLTMMKFKKFFRYIIYVSLLFIVSGFFVPQDLKMPVEGADGKSYDKRSFWYYPWGKSVTHKGVDIFARNGTNIFSATNGYVVYTGKMGRGGNVVLILGPKWRLHYYAHLAQFNTSEGCWVNHTTIIGKVGNTGNAKGKPSHLHYSIITLMPYPWRIDSSHQGYKKMFYLNPIEYL